MLLLVVMEKVLLEGSEELTDMAGILVVEDWWLSEFVGAILSLFTA